MKTWKINIRLWIICAGLSATILSQEVVAQADAPTSPKNPAVSPTPTNLGPPTEPSVTTESRPSQAAVCKTIQPPLNPDSAAEEVGKLMIHVVAQEILFSGAAYILFDLGPDDKPTGKWMPCVQVKHLNGTPAASPKAPYYEDTILALRGIAATCLKEPPGPATCKAALANYLTVQQFIAIGLPRITEQGNGANATTTIWVPYAIVNTPNT